MTKHQLRLLLASVASLACLITALFFMPWFRMELGGTIIEIDMRSIELCGGGDCASVSMGKLIGLYPTVAGLAFWCTLPLVLAIVFQCSARLLAGAASDLVTRFGYLIGLLVLAMGFSAAFLFAPESLSLNGLAAMVVERSAASVLFMLGAMLAMFALYAAVDQSGADEAVYQPVVIDDRIPVTPLSVRQVDVLPGSTKKSPSSPPGTAKKTPSQPPIESKRAPSQPPVDTKRAPSEPPIDRPKSQSSPPVVARTSSPDRSSLPSAPPNLARTKSPQDVKSPSQPIVAATELAMNRARTSSGGPIDLAARLSATAPEVAIRPPLPVAAPTPPDQIPVAPESGLRIRKKSASASPLALEENPLDALGGPASFKSARDPQPGTIDRLDPPSPVPPLLRNAIRYTATVAELTAAGIKAEREDGLKKTIAWSDIVGVVARRLPPTQPFDGATFVDIVSTAGSTLRILPWTQLRGHIFVAVAVERARAFVNIVAAQALDARLDAATKLFAESASGHAAQLPTAATLAAHDDRMR